MACAPSPGSPSCHAGRRCRPRSAACARSPPTGRPPARSRPGSPRSAPLPGRCWSTSTGAVARPPPARRGTPCCPRTPRRPPRSCCPGACSSHAPAARCGCRARSASRCAAGTPRASAPTTCPSSRPPNATTRWWRAPRPGRRSRRYAASSCSSTTGAPTRPAELRAGGLGVRELKAAASHLHVDEPTAALFIEVAAEARLLASRYDEDGNAVFAPTDAFDAWTRRPPAERWSVLATAWLGTPRLPGLVGRRDAAGRAMTALAPENKSSFAAETRRSVLTEVAALPPGLVLATGTGPAALVERLAWLRPRRPRTRAGQAVWALDEAQALGLVALGGMPAYARAVLADEDAVAPAHPAAARARGPRAGPGRPHRRRTGAARAGPRSPPPDRGRGGVAGRGHGLPLHRTVGTPRARPRLDRGRAARVRRRDLQDAGPPAADVPHRRHRPHLRDGPGRPRRGVHPGRRRGGPHRADAAPAGRGARPETAGPHRAGEQHPARHPAAATEGDGRGAGRRGAGRVPARRAARPAARPDPQGARLGRARHPRVRLAGARRGRHPGRRPRGGRAASRPTGRSPPATRWAPCVRRWPTGPRC